GNKARVLKLRRLQKVGTSQRVDTSDDTVMDNESNQGRMIDEVDKDDVVVLMDEKEEDKKVEEAKRVGKGFSGVETPLFEGMMVGQEIKEEGDAVEHVEEVTAGDDVH
nr:hypothetical protein [Tanacetum cinerariifolium]